MDRPSQDPPEPAAPRPPAAESPLSFPIEPPRPAGPEPGSGALPELSRFPAEVGRVEGAQGAEMPPLRFPAEVGRAEGAEGADVLPRSEPLRFPAEAPRAEGGQGDVLPQAEPLRFPAEAPRPTESPSVALPQATPLPYPVAQLPGAASAPQPVPGPLPVPGPPPTPSLQPAAPPEGPPSPASALRFLPPTLALVAAFMAGVGCFLPLFRLREYFGSGQTFLDDHMIVTETAWGSSVEFPGREVFDEAGAPVGIPALIAVVLLVVAALIGFSRPGNRLGRVLVVVGAVFAAGVVTTIGMGGVGWSVMPSEGPLDVTTGPGMWLLIAGTVVAAAAAVLAHLPGREPPAGDWADPAVAYADTPTPPSGVAITVLPPEPADDDQPR